MNKVKLFEVAWDYGYCDYGDNGDEPLSINRDIINSGLDWIELSDQGLEKLEAYVKNQNRFRWENDYKLILVKEVAVKKDEEKSKRKTVNDYLAAAEQFYKDVILEQKKREKEAAERKKKLASKKEEREKKKLAELKAKYGEK